MAGTDVAGRTLVVPGSLRIPCAHDAPEHNGGVTPTPSGPERAGLQVREELSKAFVVTKAIRWILTAPLDYERPIIIQTDSSAVAPLMLELRRRQHELSACKVILETDCSVAASLLTTAPLGSLPPKWMRYRMLLAS
jgi:hypothetical protein